MGGGGEEYRWRADVMHRGQSDEKPSGKGGINGKAKTAVTGDDWASMLQTPSCVIDTHVCMHTGGRLGGVKSEERGSCRGRYRMSRRTFDVGWSVCVRLCDDLDGRDGSRSRCLPTMRRCPCRVYRVRCGARSARGEWLTAHRRAGCARGCTCPPCISAMARMPCPTEMTHVARPESAERR